MPRLRVSNESVSELTAFRVDIDMFYEDHSPASSDYEEGPYWQY